MKEISKVLGKVDLILTHVEGTKKDGSDIKFDYFSIQLGDAKCRIVPRTEDKSLFEYKLGIGQDK